MREIKFRAWDIKNKRMVHVWAIGWKTWDRNAVENVGLNFVQVEFDDGTYELQENEIILMQFTGLHDENGLTEIYEGDIITPDGTIGGNKHENEILLEEKTNLVVEGVGTEKWADTEQEARKRGCKYAKRYAI